MIGDIEVSSLKGAMDVRHSFPMLHSAFALTKAYHSSGLTIELAWSLLYLQLPHESRRFYPVFTIVSLVKRVRKPNSMRLQAMTNRMNFSRYAQLQTTKRNLH